MKLKYLLNNIFEEQIKQKKIMYKGFKIEIEVNKGDILWVVYNNYSKQPLLNDKYAQSIPEAIKDAKKAIDLWIKN